MFLLEVEDEPFSFSTLRTAWTSNGTNREIMTTPKSAGGRKAPLASGECDDDFAPAEIQEPGLLGRFDC